MALLVQMLLQAGPRLPQVDISPGPRGGQGARPAVDSLPLPVQYALSRDLGRDDPAYHLAREGGAYRASNAGSGLVAAISAGGMQLRAGADTWSLALAGWGRGGERRPVPPAGPVVAEANRLEVPRGPLSEWYIHGPLGLQGGWTVAEPPEGTADGPLTLVLSQGGSLAGRVDPDTLLDPGQGHRGLALVDRAGAIRGRYGGLLAHDAKGRALPAWFVVEGAEVQVCVDDRGARYPVVIDPWVQVSKLTTSGGLFGDKFGSAVAVSGDGRTVVVNAAYHPFGAATGWHRGAVYVYTRPESGWVSTPLYRARLMASDGAAEDYMGLSLAVSNDGSTVVAGSPRRDTSRGAAYVFVRPPGGWVDATEMARITAEDGASHDRFGTGVAISGDGRTIAIGAPGQTSGGLSVGAVYLYERPASGWSSTAVFKAKLTNSEVVATERFAWVVSVSGDGQTVAVSAPYAGAGGTGRGAVYVYERPPQGWANTDAFVAKLTANDGEDDDGLGSDLALSGEGHVMVAGAYGNSGGGTDRGAVYVYQRPAAGWSSTGAFSAKLTASDGTDYEEFGEAVSVSADGGTVVAGARYNAGGASARGAVYVCLRPGANWSSSATCGAKLTSNGINDGDEFGSAVAVSADGGMVVGGVPEHNPGGAALVYVRPQGGWKDVSAETAKLVSVDGGDGDKIGWAVAVSGNGSTVIASAPWDAGTGPGDARGAVYVYERSEMGWAPAATFGAKLMIWDGGSGDGAGWAAAISADGQTVVAGAPWHDAAGADRGAVYVFRRPASGWVTTSTYASKLTAADGGNGDGLGWSVAVDADGSTVVAGAPFHDEVGGDWGAAYVYERPAGGWPATATSTAKLTDATSGSGSMGWSVAVSGDGATVVAGVPHFDEDQPSGLTLVDVGRVYVYQRPGSTWSTLTAPSATLTQGGGQDSDLMGCSVAVNWDGSLVASGTPGHEGGGTNRGAVHLYRRPAGGWQGFPPLAGTLTAGSGGNGDALGWWVSLSADADRVVAGAPNYNGPGTDCGAAYVYERPAGGWPPLTTTGMRLLAGDCSGGDVLGWSVSVSADGSTVAGGAPNHDLVGTDRGAAYVFAMTSPPAFISGPPPSPVPVGAPYSHQFQASGNPPPTFSVQSGSVPPGLTLDGASGLLGGTPTTPGSYDFVVRADNGVAPAATQAVTVEVQAVQRLWLPLIVR
jgi:hypothetical protein